jgi:hypothetical protein
MLLPKEGLRIAHGVLGGDCLDLSRRGQHDPLHFDGSIVWSFVKHPCSGGTRSGTKFSALLERRIIEPFYEHGCLVHDDLQKLSL